MLDVALRDMKDTNGTQIFLTGTLVLHAVAPQKENEPESRSPSGPEALFAGCLYC